MTPDVISMIGDGSDVTDRPRERMWSQGSDRISDAELIGLILGTGRPGRGAVALGHDVLAAVGGVGGLARAAPHDLISVDGLGRAQAARVAAAIALGVRAVERSRARIGTLHCADDVHHRLWPRLAGLDCEVFVVIGIDARNVVMVETEVARGHLTGVEVHPREVFRPLVRAGAAAGVCVHNHPSGDPTPSLPDLELTQRLRAAGDLLGIPIVDHVVLADGGAVSIAEWVAGYPTRVEA
jgi:DNA repair protein RadC